MGTVQWDTGSSQRPRETKEITDRLTRWKVVVGPCTCFTSFPCQQTTRECLVGPRNHGKQRRQVDKRKNNRTQEGTWQGIFLTEFLFHSFILKPQKETTNYKTKIKQKPKFRIYKASMEQSIRITYELHNVSITASIKNCVS